MPNPENQVKMRTIKKNEQMLTFVWLLLIIHWYFGKFFNPLAGLLLGTSYMNATPLTNT